LTQKRFKPLYFAWGFGSVAIIAALVFSYYLDLPTGYSIIFCIVGSALAYILTGSVRSKTD